LAHPAIDPDQFRAISLGPLFYEDDIVKESLPIVGGSARAFNRPGLGVELDEGKIEKYRVR